MYSFPSRRRCTPVRRIALPGGRAGVPATVFGPVLDLEVPRRGRRSVGQLDAQLSDAAPLRPLETEATATIAGDRDGSTRRRLATRRFRGTSPRRETPWPDSTAGLAAGSDSKSRLRRIAPCRFAPGGIGGRGDGADEAGIGPIGLIARDAVSGVGDYESQGLRFRTDPRSPACAGPASHHAALIRLLPSTKT